MRAGGHSVAGMSARTTAAWSIDVRPMKDIRVDPEQRTVTVGAGVTWGEFDRATQEHGLATTGGRVSTTGVAGLHARWRVGLAGTQLRADLRQPAVGRPRDGRRDAGDRERDRGAGPVLGAARRRRQLRHRDAFTFDLHPLGPEVLAGLMLWPGEAGRDADRGLPGLRCEAAPDDSAAALVLLTGPPEPFVPDHLQGTTVVGDRACCGRATVGRRGRGDRATAGSAARRSTWPGRCLRRLPVHDRRPAGLPAVLEWRIPRQPAGRRGRRLRQVRRRPAVTDHASSSSLPWGGAVGRVPDEATPLAHRTAPLDHAPVRRLGAPGRDRGDIAWVRGLPARTSPASPTAACT